MIQLNILEFIYILCYIYRAHSMRINPWGEFSSTNQPDFVLPTWLCSLSGGTANTNGSVLHLTGA